MTITTQRRVSAGVREGGQFTVGALPEADVALDVGPDVPPTVPQLTDTQRQAVEHLARHRHSWPSIRGNHEDVARYTEPVLRKLEHLGLAHYVVPPVNHRLLPYFEAAFKPPEQSGPGRWVVDLPATAASSQIAGAVVRGHLYTARGGLSSFYQPPTVRVVGTIPMADGTTRFVLQAGAGEKGARRGL